MFCFLYFYITLDWGFVNILIPFLQLYEKNDILQPNMSLTLLEVSDHNERDFYAVTKWVPETMNINKDSNSQILQNGRKVRSFLAYIQKYLPKYKDLKLITEDGSGRRLL